MLPLALGVSLLLAPQDPDGDQDRPRAAQPVRVASLHAQSPASLQEAFLATNLGTLLTSEDGANLAARLGFDAAAWQQLSGGAAAAPAIAAWRGAVDLVFLLDSGTEPADPERLTERMTVLGRVVGDDADAMERLAAALDEGMSRDAEVHAAEGDGPRTARTVSGVSILTEAPGHGASDANRERRFAWVPSAAGASVAEIAALLRTETVFANADGAAATSASAPAPLALDVDLAALAPSIATYGMDHLPAALGVDTLRTLRMTLAPSGPHVALRYEVDFAQGADRRLFGALMPAAAGVPALAAKAPEGRSWKAGHLDLDALLKSVVRAVGVMRTEKALTDDDELRELLREEAGIDILEFTGALSSAVLLIDDGARDWWSYDLEGFCALIAIADRPRFDAFWTKEGEAFCRQMLGLEAEGETDEHGVRYHSGPRSMFTPALTLARSDRLIGLAFGDDGLQRLREVMTAVSKDADPDALTATELPEGFGDLRSAREPGVTGLARLDTLTGLALATGSMELLFHDILDLPRGMLLEPPRITAAEQEQLRQLFDAHHLGSVRTVTRFHGDTWQHTVYW